VDCVPGFSAWDAAAPPRQDRVRHWSGILFIFKVICAAPSRCSSDVLEAMLERSRSRCSSKVARGALDRGTLEVLEVYLSNIEIPSAALARAVTGLRIEPAEPQANERG
jgi:hypothetical protein